MIDIDLVRKGKS